MSYLNFESYDPYFVTFPLYDYVVFFFFESEYNLEENEVWDIIINNVFERKSNRLQIGFNVLFQSVPVFCIDYKNYNDDHIHDYFNHFYNTYMNNLNRYGFNIFN